MRTDFKSAICPVCDDRVVYVEPETPIHFDCEQLRQRTRSFDWDIAPGGLQAAAFPDQRTQPLQTGLF